MQGFKLNLRFCRLNREEKKKLPLLQRQESQEKRLGSLARSRAGLPERREKPQLPSARMWKVDWDLLINEEDRDEPAKELSFTIKFREKNLRVEIVWLEVADFQRRVRYFINHPQFGDAFAREKGSVHPYHQKRTRPLKREGFERILELFCRAQARAQVYSPTWKKGNEQDLTPKIRSVLTKTELLLQRKLACFQALG